MAFYDDLRQAYASWSDQESRYDANSSKYAYRFADGFREYLGAPLEYVTPDRQTKKPYVELCKVIKNAAGEDELEPTNLYRALTREEDGFFTFGVRIVLERAHNAFPKSNFGFHARFLPKENECELRIAGKTFNLNMSDDQAQIAVYEKMRETLLRWLNSKPWDVNQKDPIGFIHHMSE
jgi:hypothetical protein